MSEFHVRVVEIGAVAKHPNADTLSITYVGGDGGYPVIFRTGEYQEGDRAVYVPVGALVPANDPRWSFLGTHLEIEAKKLRGVFSMGLLTTAEPWWELGGDVANELGITRAEPPEPSIGDEPDPGLMPIYTDIEGLRAHSGVLVDGEEVVITEKLHGESARYFYYGGLYCGSRIRWKSGKADPISAWWKTADQLELEERMSRVPGIGVFGELYGNVTGMQYGKSNGARGLRLFDAMDLASRRYLDFDELVEVAKQLDLPTVPVLYRGPWVDALRVLADGPSELAEHVREGIVIKPVKERFDVRVGRVVLKLHGEAYLLGTWRKPKAPKAKS